MSYLIILTFLLTPAYIIKFNLFGLPANLPMLWVFAVWIFFTANLISKKSLSAFCANAKSLDKKVLILITSFFVSGLIALFLHGFDRQKLGQFIVLFLQPISIFFVARFISQQYPASKYLILNMLYIILAASGIYAIIQYFTLLGLPPAWWGNSVEPKRALSFFVHPNFYALFAAPLLAFLVPHLFGIILRAKAEESQTPQGSFTGVQDDARYKYLYSIAWLLGAIGLLLSFSRAGWLGLAAAIFVYLIVAAGLPSVASAKEGKKIRKLILSAAIIIVIVIAAVPNWRYRFILPFYGEKSSVSRLSLWHTGWKGIKESPITGLGLTGFSKNWERLNTDPNLETHNYPHNVFLDFWVETGLLGLISFIGIVGIYIYRGLHPGVILRPKAEESQQRSFTNVQDDAIKLAVSLFLVALLAQGLIDNPYFKNDLAMVFWIVLSLT